jgi:hypothetical protein
MALCKGIGIMNRGGPPDLEELERRERMVQALQASSLSPQGPELSWTQGAARLAQALSAKVQERRINQERDVYKQKQSEGYGTILGQINGTGEPISPEAFEGLSIEQKGMLLQMAQQRQQQQAARQEKFEDRKNDMDDKVEYAKKIRDIDPIKQVQGEIYRYSQVLGDAAATPEHKAEAQERINRLQGSVSAMSPSKTTVNVDASQKAEDAGLKKRKELLEEKAVSKEELTSDIGLGADDKLFRLGAIDTLIEDGAINNQNMSKPGQALNYVAAGLGLPNDTGAIGTLVKTANQELVDARQQMKGQGQISDKETSMLAATVLDANSTMEQIKEYSFVAKQAYQRQKDMLKLQEKWIEQYGSTTARNPSGESFREVQGKLMERKPLMSLTSSKKMKESAASMGAKSAYEGSTP